MHARWRCYLHKCRCCISIHGQAFKHIVRQIEPEIIASAHGLPADLLAVRNRLQRVGDNPISWSVRSLRLSCEEADEDLFLSRNLPALFGCELCMRNCPRWFVCFHYCCLSHMSSFMNSDLRLLAEPVLCNVVALGDLAKLDRAEHQKWSIRSGRPVPT